MAELIESYFHPNVIDLHTFDKYANSTKNKVDNWNRIILVLRNLRYRFKKLEVNVDVNLLMNERKGSAVRVLRRFYTGLMRRGITPETKFLKRLKGVMLAFAMKPRSRVEYQLLKLFERGLSETV